MKPSRTSPLTSNVSSFDLHALFTLEPLYNATIDSSFARRINLPALYTDASLSLLLDGLRYYIRRAMYSRACLTALALVTRGAHTDVMQVLVDMVLLTQHQKSNTPWLWSWLGILMLYAGDSEWWNTCFLPTLLTQAVYHVCLVWEVAMMRPFVSTTFTAGAKHRDVTQWTRLAGMYPEDSTFRLAIAGAVSCFGDSELTARVIAVAAAHRDAWVNCSLFPPGASSSPTCLWTEAAAHLVLNDPAAQQTLLVTPEMVGAPDDSAASTPQSSVATLVQSLPSAVAVLEVRSDESATAPVLYWRILSAEAHQSLREVFAPLTLLKKASVEPRRSSRVRKTQQRVDPSVEPVLKKCRKA